MVDLICVYILLGLITWRITSLLVEEEGPRSVFVRWRRFIGIRYDEFSEAYGTNVFASAFTCMWCASVWVGFAVGLVFRAALVYMGYPVYILGLSIFDSLVLSAIAIWFQEQLE